MYVGTMPKRMRISLPDLVAERSSDDVEDDEEAVEGSAGEGVLNSSSSATSTHHGLSINGRFVAYHRKKNSQATGTSLICSGFTCLLQKSRKLKMPISTVPVDLALRLWQRLDDALERRLAQ